MNDGRFVRKKSGRIEEEVMNKHGVNGLVKYLHCCFVRNFKPNYIQMPILC